MLGNQERWQEDIFVACPLRDLVPDDHILKLVDSVFDLSWLKDEVRDLYSEQMGRPSIDPESARWRLVWMPVLSTARRYTSTRL